jgi:protein arginine N-methyltransferase 2
MNKLLRSRLPKENGQFKILEYLIPEIYKNAVYAVEASEMVNAAELVIEKNGFSETVQIFHSKVEEVALPVNKDVIISEWMGVFLLFEGMLESVIYARNKWLSEEGILFPAKAKLYLAPIYFEDYFRSRVSLFTSAYGVDMAPLLCVRSLFREKIVFLNCRKICRPFVKEDFTAHPLRGEVVPQECIISNPTVILSVDIKTIQAEEIRKFTSPFTFTPSTKHDKMHGFVTWFEVIFEGKVSDRPQIVLITSPFSKPTHWKQDVFLMNEPIPLEHADNNNFIKGVVRVSQVKHYRRHYEVEFSFSVNKIDYYKQFIL